MSNQNKHIYPEFIPPFVMESEYRVEPGEPDKFYGRASEMVREVSGYPEEGRTDDVYQELRRAKTTLAYTEMTIGRQDAPRLYPQITSYFGQRIEAILQPKSSKKAPPRP